MCSPALIVHGIWGETGRITIRYVSSIGVHMMAPNRYIAIIDWACKLQTRMLKDYFENFNL